MPLNPSDLSTRIDALLRADDFGRDAWYTATSTAPFVITYKFETTKAADFPWSYFGDEWDGHVVFRDTYDLSAPSSTDLILHEIGHALGLKHPGNYDVSGSGTPGPYLPTDEDNNKNTVMSYLQNPDTGTNATDLMVYDIAALQKWWGVNGDTNTGQNVYRALDNAELRVIYDAGGVDWIRYSGTDKTRIDLREGAFSSLDGLDGLDVAAIAYGTVIENASSGVGRDRLVGNADGNILKGGGGRDTVQGGAGADTLKGGGGGDTLVAGKGADTLIGGRGADVFVFNGTRKEGRNVIRDFDNGRDMIRIEGLTIAEVDISPSGTGGVNTTVVLDGLTQIVLKGVDSSLIIAGDFDFV